MAESAKSNESDNDSRTAAFAAAGKSNATSTANPSPHRVGTKGSKRSRRRAREARNAASMGSTFSQSAEYLEPANLEDSPSPAVSTPSEPNTSEGEVGLGKNRLATGFKSQSASTTRPNPPAFDPQSSADDVGSDAMIKSQPIEILSSDESMADSDDGGMVINIDQDDSESQEEGEITMDSPDEGEVSAMSDVPGLTSNAVASPSFPTSKLKLEDLSGDDLELQIRYALFNLDRSQIDLNRHVTCLSCLKVGHLAADCPESTCQHCAADHPTRRCPRSVRCSRCRQQGHNRADCESELRVTTVPCDLCGTLAHTEEACPQRFFPGTTLKLPNGGPVRLWVSCCICASKSHLVGDCPDADRSAASRWSLKSLAAEDVVNMSLESGTRSREIEAENRNMRPAGLQIRGRAGLHRTGHGHSAPASDDEDDFLRPPVRRGKEFRSQPQFQFSADPNRAEASNRYGRYGAPNGDGRPGWYATDSFGRRRSRSPRVQGGDQWRPSDRRPPSPRRFDGRSQVRTRSPPQGYQPPNSHQPDVRLPPRPTNKPPPGRLQPGRNVPHHPVSLPTRKGSNPNLPNKPSQSGATGQPKQGHSKKQNAGGGSSGGKKKGKKGNTN